VRCVLCAIPGRASSAVTGPPCADARVMVRSIVLGFHTQIDLSYEPDTKRPSESRRRDINTPFKYMKQHPILPSAYLRAL
jgi:hypothetical protein